MPKGKKGENAEDAHIKLGVGGLFKGISDVIGLVSKMSEEGQTVVERVGEIKGLEGLKGAKGVFGFSVRLGGLGEGVKVEPFGNVRESAGGPVVEEVREPLVDVFEEESEIKVVAELPGIREDQLRIEVKEDILSLAAEDGGRKYSKEILLPSAVDPEAMKSSCTNGVLEITLPKAS